jgi:NADH pyrophosphatase NudC (nudix superfamily)
MNLAFQEGFYFHHASQDGYVLMCKWIDTKSENRIPCYPDHYVGVGGIVVNKKHEVLLIQEVRRVPKIWKFPGGLMDPGETIKEAV